MVSKKLITTHFKMVGNVLGHELNYFVKHEIKDKKCYKENVVIVCCSSLLILVSICRVQRKHLSINHPHPHGNKLIPLLADFFLYSYQAEFMHKKKPAT